MSKVMKLFTFCLFAGSFLAQIGCEEGAVDEEYGPQESEVTAEAIALLDEEAKASARGCTSWDWGPWVPGTYCRMTPECWEGDPWVYSSMSEDTRKPQWGAGIFKDRIRYRWCVDYEGNWYKQEVNIPFLQFCLGDPMC